MSVQEIETAITQLPTPELSRLAAWFEEYQADLWDQQIEADALAGRLDALGAQAGTVQGEVACIGKTRLVQECDKLNPTEEQAMAEEGLNKILGS